MEAPPRKRKRKPIEPTPDQVTTIAWLNAGYNCLVTGVAGVGKTFVINRFLDGLPPTKFVGITASTGIAATHIGGVTLHSWLGASPERDTPQRLCTAAWKEKHGDRLKAVNALVIDEVSMVDGALFTLAETAHRIARGNDKPWGGVQIILVGDFGQLPPVDDGKGWCYQSPAWAASNIQVLELRQVMRQQDQKWADVLRRVRVGHIDPDVYTTLQSRVNAFPPDDAVRLMTHNEQADAVNEERLAQVPGEVRIYKSIDSGEEPFLGQLRKTCLSPELLKLKVGARVMFTRNDIDGRWVNGSMGDVVALGESEVTVKLGEGDEDTHVVQRASWEKNQWGEKGPELVASRIQLPLRLAWAITTHKSQGMTMDRVSMNLRHCFAPGQAYVALSRCRTLEGVNIEDWNGADSIRAHPSLRGAQR